MGHFDGWRAIEELRAQRRRELLAEAARFDTTRLPRMEAQAVQQAERLGLDPIDLLSACEMILKAGLTEIAARDE
jgi:hypothetical protein